MIRISVCDDSSYDIELVKAEIQKYSSEKHIQFSVSEFSSPEQLLYELQDGRVADIFILDVSMPGKSGFELAEDIRKYTKSSEIIFLTSMEERAAEGYKVRALRYVIKMNLSRDFREALDCAVREVSDPEDSVVTLHRYNDYRRISYGEIVYVSRVSRQLIVYTKDQGELTDNRGITEFYALLDDERFLFIDRSCFVNVDYISRISGFDITLKNGTVLPVSRRQLHSVKQTLLERWGL
ncbi:MAG: response regulator transcription factor [Clostridia bacterium]|nr:response regulator transcription factor [Clostridia bacterium]